jgi:hypothetical protein
MRKTPRSEGIASAVPAGRPSSVARKPTGICQPLGFLEVLPRPHPVLRSPVLGRVERVPLQLARGLELLEGLDARHVDSVRVRRLNGESECMDKRDPVARLAKAERLQLLEEVRRVRRRPDPPRRLTLCGHARSDLSEERFDLVGFDMHSADRRPRRSPEDANAVVDEALDTRPVRDVREPIRCLGVLAQLWR